MSPAFLRRTAPRLGSVVNFGSANGNGVNSRAISWTQDIAADDNALLVFGAINTQAAITVAGTVGSGAVALTNLLNPPLTAYTASPNRLYLYVMGLIGIPTGVGTAISVNLGGGSAVFYNVAGAISLKGVTAFGTPVTNQGSGAAASITAAAPPNGRLVVAMTAAAGTTFTSPTGPWTDRWDAAGAFYGNNRPISLGDGPGAGWNIPLTYGATSPSTSGWGTVAIPVF